MPPEQKFYNKNSVTITNARFVVPGQTYAINGITSVTSQGKRPAVVPLLFIVPGVLLLLVALSTFSDPQRFNEAGPLALISLALIGIGVAIMVFVKPTYHIVLTTAAGQQRAWTTKDRVIAREIVAALNDAIASR